MGGHISFNCSVETEETGSKPIFVLTTPDNDEITSSTPGFIMDTRLENVRVVTIFSVLPSHAGDYTCQVIGTVASGKTSKSLHVKCAIYN